MTPEEQLRHPPIEGSSVPQGSDQALEYAHRLEIKSYVDQRKMLNAVRAMKAMAMALRDIADALR